MSNISILDSYRPTLPYMTPYLWRGCGRMTANSKRRVRSARVVFFKDQVPEVGITPAS
jgi:hypothetical protein